MEFYQAEKVKKSWGDKPCPHPGFEKIYYSGAFLTTYCCTQCGMEFTISQKLEFEVGKEIKTR